MFKKNIIAFLLFAISFELISMEENVNEAIPYYENLPPEIAENIIKEYLKSTIDNLPIPMGKNSLNEFKSIFASSIKKIRLINKATNNLVVTLKFYTIALLVQKFNTLSQDQRIDCLSFFLNQNNISLATIILLSFLDINAMDIETLSKYIKPCYELLHKGFKNHEIVTSKDSKFLLNVISLSGEQLKLLIDIQKNLCNRLLFNIPMLFDISFSRCYKPLLKILLNNYDHIKDHLPSLIVEATRGNIDKVNLTLPSNTKLYGKSYSLYALHWAIIGNPANLREILDHLLFNKNLKAFPTDFLQEILRLATNWCNVTIASYILFQFQNKLPYNIFRKVINDEYKSVFSWDNLDTPLNHAIKCQNNEHYEEIILSLINYGTDLNCIKDLCKYHTVNYHAGYSVYGADIPKTKSIVINKLLAHHKNIDRVIEELKIIKEVNEYQSYTLENISEACDRASKSRIIRTETAPTTNTFRNLNIIPSTSDKKQTIPTIEKSSSIDKYAKASLMLGIGALVTYLFYKSNKTETIDTLKNFKLDAFAA